MVFYDGKKRSETRWSLGQSQTFSEYFMIARRDQRHAVIRTGLKFIQRLVVRTSLNFFSGYFMIRRRDQFWLFHDRKKRSETCGH